MIKLTLNTGQKIWINTAHIVSVQTALIEDSPLKCHVTFVDGNGIYVQETQNQVMESIWEEKLDV